MASSSFSVYRGEVEVMRDPRAYPGIALEEYVHPVPVAGQDHHQLIPVILHDLEQDIDTFLAVILRVPGPEQVISLVNEKNPAHRPFQDAFRLGRGMADKFPDEVIAHGVD